MRTFLNLLIPLWLLLLAGLLLGGWLGLSAYRHSQQVEQLTTRLDSLYQANESIAQALATCNDREGQIALESGRRIWEQQQQITAVKDSVARLRLKAQTRYVQQVTGAAPVVASPVPSYLLPSPVSKMTITMQVCYDSAAYRGLAQQIGELDLRRRLAERHTQADVRKDFIINQTAGTLRDIGERGLFRHRRQKARRQLERILIWADRERVIQDSLTALPVPYD